MFIFHEGLNKNSMQDLNFAYPSSWDKSDNPVVFCILIFELLNETRQNMQYIWRQRYENKHKTICLCEYETRKGEGHK